MPSGKAGRRRSNPAGSTRTPPRRRAAVPARTTAAAGARPPTIRQKAPSAARLDAAAARLGIRSLRAEQRDVITAVLAGRDALVVQPTGSGKSACYQVPALLLERPVVVVSPLLALLKDQHDALARHGAPVVRLDGTVRGGKRSQAIARLGRRGALVVMTTPETLAAPEVLRALRRRGVALVAIDEAHCASEWGHDFRPAYLRLPDIVRRLGSPPVVALTATATERVRAGLVKLLGLRSPLIVAASPHRPNLHLDVMACDGNDRIRALGRLVLGLPRPGIVYASTTRDVDAVHGALRRLGVPAHRYHGRMGTAPRREEQEAFMQAGARAVMVATSAFGLGVDKPDIRYVVHYQAPASLEQYVQEAGRAGRDGERARCVLLYSEGDRAIHEHLLGQSRIDPFQLRRAAAALGAWRAEGREPTMEQLAASAALPVRIAETLVAVLEEAGLVSWERHRAVAIHAEGAELGRRARLLAGQFDAVRRHDAARLDALAEYATTRECRAQTVRLYFGVPRGEGCGTCDRCTGATPAADRFAPLARPPRRRRRRRRRS